MCPRHADEMYLAAAPAPAKYSSMGVRFVPRPNKAIATAARPWRVRDATTWLPPKEQVASAIGANQRGPEDEEFKAS